MTGAQRPQGRGAAFAAESRRGACGGPDKASALAWRALTEGGAARRRAGGVLQLLRRHRGRALLSPGDDVQGYEVLAPLHFGRTTQMYLARRSGQDAFGQLTRLKLLHPHLAADKAAVGRMLSEAHVCSQIYHDNVAHVEAVGRCRGTYFVAIEYVHGVSLAALLARARRMGKQPRRQLCVWLAAQVAEALHAVHSLTAEDGTPRNFVHGGVSARCIVIGLAGQIKLVGFGKQVGASPVRSATVATPAHAATFPVAPRAEPGGDVYALAVVTWEMLAGRAMIESCRFTPSLLRAPDRGPPPPSVHPSESTPAVDRVLLKALSPDVSQRYLDAERFRLALLRAAGQGARIDPHMVASLVRSMFAEDLERLSATWPPEVERSLDPGLESVGGVWGLTGQYRIPSVSLGTTSVPTAADQQFDTGVADDDAPTTLMPRTLAAGKPPWPRPVDAPPEESGVSERESDALACAAAPGAPEGMAGDSFEQKPTLGATRDRLRILGVPAEMLWLALWAMLLGALLAWSIPRLLSGPPVQVRVHHVLD